MRYLICLCALCLLALSACSSQQFYEGAKAGQQSNCLNYPEAEYQECIDESGDSYEQYKQQRDEVVGK
jgi:uncharacterized lipoprotein